MKRREALLTLLAGAGAATSASQPRADLSLATVSEMMALSGLSPSPGEAAQVRGFLLAMRLRPHSDPRVEPAIRLEPSA